MIFMTCCQKTVFLLVSHGLINVFSEYCFYVVFFHLKFCKFSELMEISMSRVSYSFWLRLVDNFINDFFYVWLSFVER